MPRGVTLGPRFRDGLGVRVVEMDKATGDTVEVLQLCPELCALEKAIRQQADRLSNFRHPRFVPVRGIQSVPSPHSRLGVIADHVVGPRLSEALEAAGSENVAVDTNAVLHLIRELLSAIVVLHESRKVTHGAIAPERLIVTPRGRLVIVDYTLGLALERLQYNRARLWRDFRIAMPPAAGAARFDQRADVVQVGTLAIALLLGRPLDTADYTNRLKLLLDEAGEVTLHGDRKPLSAGLREWLERALPFEARKPFATAQQANVALEQVLIKERRMGVAPAALRAFISRFLSRTGSREPQDREPPIDQSAQPSAVITTTVESPPSAEALHKADRPQRAPSPTTSHCSSAVTEADPEGKGPPAAIPPETVPESATEIGLRIIPEPCSAAASGVASGIGSEITLEVASGIDTELTVDVASGFIPEATLEIIPEATLETTSEATLEFSQAMLEDVEAEIDSSPGIASEITPQIASGFAPGGAPEAAPFGAEEFRTPAAEPLSPSPEVPGVTGFEADPGRILRFEQESGVGSKPTESPARETDVSVALRASAPEIGVVATPIRKEVASQAGRPTGLTSESRTEEVPERCQPAPEAASDDVWVIDPSDLTFDPAFLDGLYLAPQGNLGTRVPGSREKVERDQTAAVGGPPAPSPASAAVVLEGPRAAVVEGVAERTVEPLIAPVAVIVAEPVTAPIADAVGPGLPEVVAQPAASLAVVPDPVEVLPALEASWPFVPESPAPVVEAVAKRAAESGAVPAGGTVAKPAGEPRAKRAAQPGAALSGGRVAEPIRKAVAAPGAAPPAEAGAGSAAEPRVKAVPADWPLEVVAEPTASVAAVEPLEVLPALEASWPFVPEPPAPVVEAVARLAGESGAVPAGRTVAKRAAKTTAKRAVKAVAAAVAATPAETAAEAVAEPITPPTAKPGEEGIQEAVEVFERLLDSLQEAPTAPQVPAVGSLPEPASASLDTATEAPTEVREPAVATDEMAATAPMPGPEVLTAARGGEPVPPDVAATGLASASAVPAFEIELVETPAARVEASGPEARRSAGGDTAETPPTAAAPVFIPRPETAPAARITIPPPVDAPPTLDIGAASTAPLAASSPARASLPGRVPAAPTPRVLVFEPGPVPSEPAAPATPEETRSAWAPARVLAFSVRERALGLARAVPRRLVELGRARVYWKPAAAAALVLVALGGVRLATAYWFRTPPPTGGLVVETVPDGLDVFIDSTLRGRTPMSLTLPAGDHVLELRGKGLTRTLPVRIAPGIQAEERVSWPLSVRTGSLRVESEPTRANVSIDGQPKGVTPLTIEDLSARVHTLVVQGRGGRVERAVTIEPERITTVKVPVFPGWMKVFAPFDLQILEGSRALGSTDVDRIMLRAGRHQIEFVNGELGYRVVRQVDITPGAVTPVSIELPNGTLQIDAPPGFEVWLDGQRVGETPLAPLEVSLGTHEVRLKHPLAAERRQVVVVTQRGPAKVTAEGQESGR